jgi:two-component system LytT family response regulator
VDDDPLVRDLLRDLAGGFEGVEIVGEAGSVGEARQLVRQRDPNVVLLDVNLPDGSGFDLLPDLKPTTAVVFVTSAEEYAVHAFDCEAADFLLKPVARERLATALKRVRQRLALPAAAGTSTTARLSDSFLVKTLTEKKLVKIGEIKSIIAYGEYCWVYWNTDKGALLRKSLKKWLSELPEKQFVRVHRHAIINLAFLDHVEKTSTGQLKVHLRATEKPIEVSLRLAPTLNRRLKAFRS